MQGCLTHGHPKGLGIQVNYWVGLNQLTDMLNYMEAQGNMERTDKFAIGHVIELCVNTTTWYQKKLFEIKELRTPENIEGTYIAVRATQEAGMPVTIGPTEQRSTEHHTQCWGK